MAAATVSLQGRRNVNGYVREVFATSVAFANTGDTWTVPGIKTIRSIDLTPTTNVSYGFTVSGNVITLTATAGVTFLGSVSGI